MVSMGEPGNSKRPSFIVKVLMANKRLFQPPLTNHTRETVKSSDQGQISRSVSSVS
jgi:hypothetical protein